MDRLSAMLVDGEENLQRMVANAAPDLPAEGVDPTLACSLLFPMGEWVALVLRAAAIQLADHPPAVLLSLPASPTIIVLLG